MFNPTHLSLSRHNVYYLRFPLPHELHPNGHCTDIKVSLGTRCPQEALHLSRTLVYAASCFIKNKVFTSMDYQQIRAILTDHFKSILEQHKAKIDVSGSLSLDQIVQEQIKIDRITQEINVDRVTNYNQGWGIGTDEVIQTLIGKLNLNVLKGTPEFERLRIEYLKCTRSTMEQVLEYNKGYDSYVLGTPAQVPHSSQSQTICSTTKLTDVYERYEKENLRLGHWTDKTARGYRSQVSLLLEYLGKDAPMELTNKDAAKVRAMLIAIPMQARNKPQYKKLSIPELMELEHNDGMSERNINKYLQTYSSLYEWAIRQGEISNNHLKHLITKQKSQEAPRDDFTIDQIEAIKTPLLSDKAKYKDHHKWCTLIAMYTGARLNEIAQLEIADITTEDGHPCFHFTDEVKGQSDSKKGIKTFSSIRFVPIHPNLNEYGFSEYVTKMKTAGHTRLFPELSYDQNNGYGRNVGRWFSQFFLVKQGIKTPKLSFHSFRHTVAASLLQANVQEPIVQSITGHASTGVLQKVYAKGYKMSQKLEALSKLPY